MSDEMTPIECARLASALTSQDACKITGLSARGYNRAEEHPLEFTLGELKSLQKALNADGQSILEDWLRATLFDL